MQDSKLSTLESAAHSSSELFRHDLVVRPRRYDLTSTMARLGSRTHTFSAALLGLMSTITHLIYKQQLSYRDGTIHGIYYQALKKRRHIHAQRVLWTHREIKFYRPQRVQFLGPKLQFLKCLIEHGLLFPWVPELPPERSWENTGNAL